MINPKNSKVEQQREGTIQSPKEKKRSEYWSIEEMEKAKPYPMPDPLKSKEKNK